MLCDDELLDEECEEEDDEEEEEDEELEDDEDDRLRLLARFRLSLPVNIYGIFVSKISFPNTEHMSRETHLCCENYFCFLYLTHFSPQCPLWQTEK